MFLRDYHEKKMWRKIIGEWKDLDHAQRINALKSCHDIELFSFRLLIQTSIARRTQTEIRKMSDILPEEILPEDIEAAKEEYKWLYKKSAEQVMSDFFFETIETARNYGIRETVKIIFIALLFYAEKRNISFPDVESSEQLRAYFADVNRPNQGDWNRLNSKMPEKADSLSILANMYN